MAFGRRYAVPGTRAVAASNQTIIGVTSTSAVRPKIYQIVIGSSNTPADNALLWLVERYTAAGTSTAVTPTALDSGDPASTSSAGQNHSADPTFTTVLGRWAINQRATFTWNAIPDSEFVLPATASNGAGLVPSSPASATPTVDGTVYFAE